MKRTEKHQPIVEIELFWSPEDREYVVRLANQRGISALGKTAKKALKEFAYVIPAIIEISGIEAIVAVVEDDHSQTPKTEDSR